MTINYPRYQYHKYDKHGIHCDVARKRGNWASLEGRAWMESRWEKYEEDFTSRDNTVCGNGWKYGHEGYCAFMQGIRNG
jgi:hypothetical protein